MHKYMHEYSNPHRNKSNGSPNEKVTANSLFLNICTCITYIHCIVAVHPTIYIENIHTANFVSHNLLLRLEAVSFFLDCNISFCINLSYIGN